MLQKPMHPGDPHIIHPGNGTAQSFGRGRFFGWQAGPPAVTTKTLKLARSRSQPPV